MTNDDIRAWRAGLKFTLDEAAAALGLSRNTLHLYEKGEREGKPVEIPKAVELACAAIAAGITEYKRPTNLVPVYSFKAYDLATDREVVGRTKRTREAIEKIRGQILIDSEEWVDIDTIDADGRYIHPNARARAALLALPPEASIFDKLEEEMNLLLRRGPTK